MQNDISVIKDNRKHTGLLFLALLVIFVLFFQNIIAGRYYISTVAIILWLPTIVLLYHRLGKHEKTFVVVSITFLIISLAYYLLGVSQINIAYFIRIIVWIFAGIISVYVISFFSDKELKTTFVVFTIILFFILLIFLLFGKSTILLKDDDDTTGSTWMGSIFMLLTGVFLIIFLNIKQLAPRLLSLLLFLLTLYANFFVMQRATNVLFTFFEIAFILIFSIKKRGVIWFLSILFIGVSCFLYFSGVLINLLEWYAAISTDRISIRIQSIIFALEYGDIEAGGGSFTRRSELLTISWDTFTSGFSSFVFGVGEHKHGNNIIGNHSFILDSLASYGIVGGVLLFVYFKKQYQIIMERIDKNIDSVLFLQFMVVFLMYVFRNFYGFLANACANFIILIYIPLSIQFIQNNKSTKRFVL